MFEPVVVPLRSKRAQIAKFLQKLQHALPSIVLLGDGLTRVQEGHGESLALGGVELAASLAVIGSVIRGLRDLRKSATAKAASPERSRRVALHVDGKKHPHVDWIDIFIGLMLFVEAYVHQRETGHLPRPTVLLGVTMIALGLAHHRLMEWGSKRRALRVTSDGLSIAGRRPFTRMTLKWAEVESVTIDGNLARIVSVDGRRREVDLADALNPDAVREALLFASRHHASLGAARSAQTLQPKPEN